MAVVAAADDWSRRSAYAQERFISPQKVSPRLKLSPNFTSSWWRSSVRQIASSFWCDMKLKLLLKRLKPNTRERFIRRLAKYITNVTCPRETHTKSRRRAYRFAMQQTIRLFLL